MSNENNVVLPEPVAWLAHYEDREGNSKYYTSTHKDLAQENDTNGEPQSLFTEQQLRALLATATGLPAQVPFGYVTKTKTGVQHFYPVAPYLDNAVECVTVYATPQAQASGVVNG